MNYEVVLKELENIVEKMESGQLSLEDSLKCFEEGVKSARLCQASLKDAEQKIQVLVEQNGEIRSQPFLVENEVV